ncbi:MAG: hypothetical protein WC178_02480 [Candidatus Paceibacterota bacterium]
MTKGVADAKRILSGAMATAKMSPTEQNKKHVEVCRVSYVNAQRVFNSAIGMPSRKILMN